MTINEKNNMKNLNFVPKKELFLIIKDILKTEKFFTSFLIPCNTYNLFSRLSEIFIFSNFLSKNIAFTLL